MRNESFVTAVLAASVFVGAASAQCAPHMPPREPMKYDNITGAVGRPTTPAKPSAPSAPSPGGPAAPAPSAPGPATTGPITPRASAPMPVAKGPTTGARGMAIDFERGETSKQRLRIDWLHPVPPDRSGEGTAAVGPMPYLEALEVLWGQGDDRPLLVLRECDQCQGNDYALLSRSVNNDRTMLLTKWFRTVKLPPHVTQPAHPFFNVFAEQDQKGLWPHLFLLAEPGAAPVFFGGDQTPAAMARALAAVVEQRYAKSSQKALKAWLSCLDDFDALDKRKRELSEKLLEVRANEGPASEKAVKLDKQIAELTQQRAAVEEREAKVRDLGLLPMSRALFAKATPAAAGMK
ncbi:MAG: hypothetical protein IT455_07285 [Planctomycetes bacterium]|nr:hypothetical protein [Planctomycetota bacterium]